LKKTAEQQSGTAGLAAYDRYIYSTNPSLYNVHLINVYL